MAGPIVRYLDVDRELHHRTITLDSLYRGVCRFAVGSGKKVLIAKSLCEKAHLHIWDEPMNYIDVISRMQIENLLLEYAPTILFVEHDKTFCENVATKTVAL